MFRSIHRFQRRDFRRVGIACPAPLSCGLFRRCGRFDYKFTERIPGTTFAALALPFIMVGAAFTADVSGFGFGFGSCHRSLCNPQWVGIEQESLFVDALYPNDDESNSALNGFICRDFPTTRSQNTRHKKTRQSGLMDLPEIGIEPTTSSLRMTRSTN